MSGVREQVPQRSAAVAELFPCPCCTSISSSLVTLCQIHHPCLTQKRILACTGPIVSTSCTELCAEGSPRGCVSYSKNRCLPLGAEAACETCLWMKPQFLLLGKGFSMCLWFRAFKHFTRDFPEGPALIPASSFAAWRDQARGCFNLGEQVPETWLMTNLPHLPGIWANSPQTLPVLGAACASSIAAVHRKEVYQSFRSVLSGPGTELPRCRESFTIPFCFPAGLGASYPQKGGEELR